jgi:osmotically-inducible protein OsmY
MREPAMRNLRTAMRAMLVIAIASSAPIAVGAEADNPYNDPPPLQATRGIAGCAAPQQRILTPEQARREAHQRIERGTSCWLAGQCEAGGDYKDDAKTNARVAEAISNDPRFVHTSLWVETLRKFVTIKGCLADAKQGGELEALVKAIEGVKLVWQEAVVAPDGKR